MSSQSRSAACTPPATRAPSALTLADHEVHARTFRTLALVTWRGTVMAAAVRRAAGPARRVRAGIRRWRSRRDVHRALTAMDDRLLRDLGISRRDIPAIAAGLVRSRAELPSATSRQPYPSPGAGQPAARDGVEPTDTPERDVA